MRVFGKAYTSQVLPFGATVPTGNLDQRWGHGISVGKAPMTDEHIILTENRVQKARSLHRVPPEERFVISELKKVRGLPWNGRADNLKATIVTQQNQGPSGHRRVYLTTGVVARHGATPGCSGCVGLGPHTEACRVRLEKALADEKADPVEAPVGPITEPATECPKNQQEPASSSSGPAAPMPTQNLHDEQMGFTDGVGSTRTQRAQKTNSKGEASVTTSDRADGGRFGNRCPLCSCVIQQGRDDDWWFVRD